MLLDDFKRNLSQDAAIVLNGFGFTTKPILLTINDDQGIFEGMFYINQNDYDMFRLSKQDSDLYLIALASRLLGVGIYVAAYQKRLGKGADEFLEKDMRNIKKAFDGIDTYKLGIKTLEIKPSSKKKQSIDKVILTILERAKKFCPTLDKDLIYLKEYLRVFYYVGVTIETYK